MIRRIGVLIAAWTWAAVAGEDPQLAGIRSLAVKMSKDKRLGGDSAYCEYAPISQVDGCSGPNRNALRHRIGREGAVETWVYRSPRESGDPIGHYRGRIDDKPWRALLQAIAAMRWTEDPAGTSGPRPPPGPTESISVLTLSDGKQTADYGKSGPAPEAIDAAFAQPGMLARRATDTVWQLSLVNPKAETRKDSVYVSAEWKWRGPPGSRILFSETAGGEFCGKAAFKWFLDTAEYSVEWHAATAQAGKGRGATWDLPGPKASTVRLAFAYDGPKGKPKAKRVGMLAGVGIRLLPGGSRDTVSATVATDRFEF